MTRYRYSFSSNATNVPFNDQNRANRVQLSSYRRITRGTPGKRSSPIVNPAARSSPYPIAAPRGGPSKRSAPSAQIFLKNGPTYHYSELLKTSYDEIHGDLIKVYSKTNPNPDDNVKEPRGVAYDEEMKKWIVADTGTNSIRLYDINSKIGDCVTGNLKKPTAIAVCQPGKTLAILDYEAIRLYDYRNQEFFAVVKIENCRGLGCTIRGDLVTIQRTELASQNFEFHLRFFSSTQNDQLIVSYPYIAPPIPKSKPSRITSPSFLDVSADRICLTDLATSSFTVYELDPYRPSIYPIVQKQAHGRYEGHFEFISAAKLDASGEIFIADAAKADKKYGRLQYFDSNGIFKKMVNFSDDFACVSGMAMNRENQLMVSHYKSKGSDPGSVRLYQLSGGRERTRSSNFSASATGYSSGSFSGISPTRRSLLPTPLMQSQGGSIFNEFWSQY